MNNPFKDLMTEAVVIMTTVVLLCALGVRLVLEWTR